MDRQTDGRTDRQRNEFILVGLATLTGSSRLILPGLATLTGSSRLTLFYSTLLTLTNRQKDRQRHSLRMGWRNLPTLRVG
jgi:hypothetical protein